MRRLTMKKISNAKLKIKYIIIFAFIIISGFIFETSNSRYISNKNDTYEILVAKPVIEMESVSNNTISDMLPGDTAEYTFKIKNADETRYK